MENLTEIKKARIRLMMGYLRLLRSQDDHQRIEAFLLILFLPFSDKPQEYTLKLAFEIFRQRYEKVDPGKDLPYIKDALRYLIDNPDIPEEKRYVNILGRVTVDFIRKKVTDEPFNVLIRNLLIDVYFFKERKSLLYWPDWIKKTCGHDRLKAIVNAPMGLGKTYQIARALAFSDYSAVIFMPTIKTRDAIYNNLNLFVPGSAYCAVGRDSECECFREYLDMKQKRIKPTGIFCTKCSDFKIEQNREILKHRIIVTTHAQYPRFHFNSGWTGQGKRFSKKIKKEDLVPRDFFIIDEDITTGLMFDCEEVSYREFSEYNSWVQSYPKRLDQEADFKKELINLKRILNRATDSSYILPTRPGFKLTLGDAIKIGKWVTKGIKEGRIDKKITDLIIGAFNQGCSNNKLSGHKIYFNEPLVFPLFDFDGNPLPIHVFFDATKVNDTFLNTVFPPNEKKIPRLKCKARPLGKVNVYHVDKTDLPKSEFNFLSPKVGIYLKYLVWRQKGMTTFKTKDVRKNGYFVVTTRSSGKPGRINGYKDYVKDAFESMGIPVIEVKGGNPKEDDNRKNNDVRKSRNYAILTHYGNLRGINDAIGCNIGILLGTWRVPEYIELAWAIPFLGKLAKQSLLREIFPSAVGTGFVRIDEMKEYRNNEKNITKRVYKREWDFIQKIADWKRTSENEQALGRNRSIFHDVDFYIVTKDEVMRYPIFDGAVRKEDKIGDIIFQKGEYANSVYVPVMLAIDEMRAEGIKQFTRKEIQTRANQILKEIGEGSIADRTVTKHIQRYERTNSHVIKRENEIYVIPMSKTTAIYPKRSN